METGFMNLVWSCGQIYVLLFACCIIGALVTIIANIINLGKARLQSLSSGQEIKHFKFWPKTLKGIAILSFLIGLLGSVTGFMSLFWTMSLKLESSGTDYRGAYESLTTMYFGTLITLCLFLIYYIFRWRLYKISHHKISDNK